MTSPIKLSIVFLNFNKLTETQETAIHLQALCATRHDIEIIAVDNGSVDGTAEYLQAQPGIISILLPDNSGIAAYSAGFNKAQGDYLLILDDDSCPQNLSGIDQALLTLDQRDDIGVIAAHIQTPDGNPQWSWHLPISDTFCRSPFFIGCGFLIRRELFAKIGWYPDDFFLYQNEVDVSFQVRLQGYDIFYDPACIIVHRGIPSQRPGWRRVFFPTRNTLWLIRRYYPQPQASYLIFSRLIIGLTCAVRFNELITYFKAVRDGLLLPITKNSLPPELRKSFLPFWKQNSLIHQLLRRT
ncbi:MAG: glycosyltransferase [Gammaproteobacteria bacterium]|jgi:GT2 family glycosyltransferase|nr:glycosyltransferase [Gammaproteobacteria bacterium]MBT4147212.1 glycosyltransferase [Gammaproteobacteria bacterium]MBT5223310.1 glycosyltransferase [Gammaproteobacteria bacterium]MBT5827022.1 glycosyltransferase [Gammaproteobacteria bacterium]MBT5967149.1 glycosyltransferase [Gammaproteobacteria bacterium]